MTFSRYWVHLCGHLFQQIYTTERMQMLTSAPERLVQAYLYVRMYYNKTRQLVETWWQTYLLFKAVVLVVPMFLFLLLLGLWSIVYNVDATPVLKTIYEIVFLFYAAGFIFVIVLALATLNGRRRNLRARGEHEEITPEEVIEYIRLHQGEPKRTPTTVPPSTSKVDSMSYGVLSTLFGDYQNRFHREGETDDEEDDENGAYNDFSEELEAMEQPLAPEELEMIQILITEEQQMMKQQQSQQMLSMSTDILVPMSVLGASRVEEGVNELAPRLSRPSLLSNLLLSTPPPPVYCPLPLANPQERYSWATSNNGPHYHSSPPPSYQETVIKDHTSMV